MGRMQFFVLNNVIFKIYLSGLNGQNTEDVEELLD